MFRACASCKVFVIVDDSDSRSQLTGSKFVFVHFIQHLRPHVLFIHKGSPSIESLAEEEQE